MNYELKKKIAKKIKYRPPIYGKKTLLIAFEFGAILSEVAMKNKIELDKEIILRAEKILLQELRTNGLQNTAMNFTPLILAALEIK